MPFILSLQKLGSKRFNIIYITNGWLHFQLFPKPPSIRYIASSILNAAPQKPGQTEPHKLRDFPRHQCVRRLSKMKICQNQPDRVTHQSTDSNIQPLVSCLRPYWGQGDTFQNSCKSHITMNFKTSKRHLQTIFDTLTQCYPAWYLI